MDQYQSFLESKRIADRPSGFNPASIGSFLFNYQSAIVRWACRRGRAALFCDTGLGKTAMQLEWANAVTKETGGRVLILAPLAVAQQTVREGARFGIDVTYDRTGGATGAIVITNYEMLHKFDLSQFVGLVLDESSILKSYTGKVRNQIIDSAQSVPYKLAATATPAPNDYMELGNHAEFLGVMTRTEMLATFFVHDGGDTSVWRLKGHAEDEFWEWVSSWAVMIKSPGDLGYSVDGFDLPPLNVYDHAVTAHEPTQGYLIPMEANTLNERRQARRESIGERVELTRRLVEKSDDYWLIWCDLNDESAALAKSIPGAVEVKGSDTADHKEWAMTAFSQGEIKVLVTKPSICGFGMNWQHCNNIAFVGLSDSYEQFYQAVRRCYRFGQKREVNVHIIFSERESAVIRNIRRKEMEAQSMANNMIGHMTDLENEEMSERQSDDYTTGIERGADFTVYLGDCVEMMKQQPDDSIDFSVFSPPFASLYTYSNSERDMGNARSHSEFYEHYRYLVAEQFRTLKPGRLLSFHCMNLPTSKERDGYIGIADFRGDLIRIYQDAGFIFHSEVCIWKDPVTAMQRTKAIGLLYKQLKKDSALSRQGIPDYLVTMRKPGVNPDPITKTPDAFPVDLWQRFASPVWMDINPSNTLQYRSARDHKDERHICPLQLEVIERAIDLWSNPGDLVCSPFTGIGSEGYVAIKRGRRFVGAELKPSYFRQAVRNLHAAEREKDAPTLFDLADAMMEV